MSMYRRLKINPHAKIPVNFLCLYVVCVTTAQSWWKKIQQASYM